MTSRPSRLWSCSTLFAGLNLLSTNSTGEQQATMDIAAMIRASQDRIAKLHAQLAAQTGGEAAVAPPAAVPGAPILATEGEPMITGHAVQSLPATLVETQNGNTQTESSQSLGLTSSEGGAPAPPEVCSQDRQPDSLHTPPPVHTAPSPDKVSSVAPSPAKVPNPCETPTRAKVPNPCETPSPTKGLKRVASALTSNPDESSLPSASSPASTTAPARPRSKCPSYWKMYRYFQPRKDGSLKCSPEALELYQSETGREALRNLLLKHGDFKTVEVHAKKYHRKLHQKLIQAGWYTRSHLQTICAWTKKMTECAFQGAKTNNRLRVNAIHQDEEALLILNETFQLIDESGEEINMNGTFELEDDSGFLLKNSTPSMEGPPEVVVGGLAASSNGAASSSDAPASSTATASFKLTFPALQQNQSALGLLPAFLEVLGKKIDACADQLDKLAENKHARAAELSSSIREILAKLKENYKKLTTKQTDSISCKVDKPFNDALLQIYVDCTKNDVVMNNYVTRARSLKAGSTRGSKKSPKSPKEKKAKKDKKAKAKK